MKIDKYGQIAENFSPIEGKTIERVEFARDKFDLPVVVFVFDDGSELGIVTRGYKDLEFVFLTKEQIARQVNQRMMCIPPEECLVATMSLDGEYKEVKRE